MRKRKSIMGRVYVVLLFSFLYVPIAMMIVQSFNANKGYAVWTGFTLQWYRQLFHNELILRSLLLTLVLAFASATVATVLGTMAAVGINRMRRGPRTLIMNISYMPIVNPEIITGISLMLLLVGVRNGLAALDPEASGFFGWLAANLMGLPSLLIAHITFNLPYVLFMVSPKLRQMDIRLYEAALDLGCNERQAFFKVVLPEIFPAVLSSFLICLTYSIDDFTISWFNAGNHQTLPMTIFAMTKRRVSPEINALSAIMFVVVLAIILAANFREAAAEKKKRQRARL